MASPDDYTAKVLVGQSPDPELRERAYRVLESGTPFEKAAVLVECASKSAQVSSDESGRAAREKFEKWKRYSFLT